MCVSKVQLIALRALGLDLKRIQLCVILNDQGRALDVALLQAAHGLADSMLRQPAHLADECAQPIEIVVEGLECMSG